MKKILVNSLLLVIIIFCALILLTAKDNFTNIRSFVVQSGSMEPALSTGSVIITFPQLEYKTKDIITYELSGQTITHRINGIVDENNSLSFITKGDANRITDQNSISINNVIGKTIFSVPYVGYIVTFLRTLPGFLALIILPTLIFITLEIINIKREFTNIIDKNVEEKAKSLG